MEKFNKLYLLFRLILLTIISEPLIMKDLGPVFMNLMLPTEFSYLQISKNI
jgi:hypothetical protein